MPKILIHIIIIVLLICGNVEAKSTHSNTVSMVYYYTNVYQDTNYICHKVSKKDQKQVKFLWGKLKKLKNNKKMVISTKKYKNLEKLLYIIDCKYTPYSTIEFSEESTCNNVKVTIKGKDVQKAIKENKKYAKKYKKLLKKLNISRKTTEEEAVLKINNYISNLLEYKENTAKNVSKYGNHVGLYSKNGICIDYALLFYYMSRSCGLECGVILDHNINHAYNVVCINGKKTYIDVCWNDSVGKNRWLFLSEEEISKDHTIDAIIWNIE